MPFPQPDSHRINLQEAAILTARFRDQAGPDAVIGGVFNAADIRRIIDQPGCEGLRYYYGINDNAEPVLVLVGVAADNTDLFEGELAELSAMCPSFCAIANPLNSNP